MKPEDIAQAIGIKPADSTIADKGRAILAELDALAETPTAFKQQLAQVVRSADKVAALATLWRLDREDFVGWTMQARAVPRCMRDVGTLAKMVEERGKEQVERLAPPVRVAEPGERETYDGPDCVPDGWAAPVGWRVTPSGVFREHGDELERVAVRPVWVIGSLEDVDGHGYSVRLAWMQLNGSVGIRVVPAVSCADARSLISLATYGFPVTSANARNLAVFIDAALEANRTRLPTERVAHRMGWLPGGGFLLGSTYIGPQAGHTMLAPDPGLDQLASAYRTRGSWSGWLEEVVEPARAAPMLWLSIYNAIASVLIEPFDLGDNWSIDRSGETSRGKSTVGRAACSVWSDPRQRMSWKTTPVGIEATASLLRNLPLSLDDSKKARKPQDVAAVVYMHSGGTGKLRGKPGEAGRGTGIRTTERWHSALDSDGEQSLTSFTQDAGARARVLVMTGDPLPDGRTALQVGLGCEAHYGHLGRRVLGWLANPDNRKTVRGWWAGVAERWRDELTPHGPVAQRLSRIIAALHVAKLVCEAVGLPAPRCEPLRYACECAMQGGNEADLPADALRAVFSVAASRPTSFFGRHETTQDGVPKVPSQGWMGVWQPGDNWQVINLRTNVVRQILKAEGFDRGIPDRWLERGWLQPVAGMGKRAKIRLDGANVNVYRFSRAAIDEVVG